MEDRIADNRSTHDCSKVVQLHPFEMLLRCDAFNVLVLTALSLSNTAL